MSPYVSNPDLIEPEPTAIIWRYMDFTKLLAMLENHALFFTGARIFSEKFDYFEGAYPDHWIEFVFDPEFREGFRVMCEKFWAFLGINCWHLNVTESAAMWKIYSARGYGIAIQSTFDRLKSSFSDTEIKVYAGLVNYIDYEKGTVPYDRAIHAYFHKRKLFEYEQELRFVAEIGFEPFVPEVSGINVIADINQIIENIYVSPNTSQWVINLIQNILPKYSIEAEIIESDISKKPLFRS